LLVKKFVNREINHTQSLIYFCTLGIHEPKNLAPTVCRDTVMFTKNKDFSTCGFARQHRRSAGQRNCIRNSCILSRSESF
jgi:hypothetical protein